MTKKGIEDAIEADLAGDPIQPPHATPEADYDPNNPEHRKYWPQALIEALHAERASEPPIESMPKAQARPNGSEKPGPEPPPRPEPPPPTDEPPPRQKNKPNGSGKGPPHPPHSKSNTKSAGDDNLRIPKNEETERYALAWVIRNPRKFLTAAQRLKPDHFYAEHHRNIFLCMHALATQGLAVDVPHVITELKTRGQLWREGISYCWDLEVYRPKLLDFPRYADELERYRQMREAQDIGDYVVKETGSGRAPSEVLSEIKERLGRLVDTLCTDGSASSVNLKTFQLPTPEDTLTVAGISFPRKHHSILFGDGGACKSYLGLLIAGRLTQRGMRILLLDWELDGSIHHDRLRRIFGTDEKEIPDIEYYRCIHPLVQELDLIKQIIKDKKVDFVIYDSIAYGADGPPEESAVAVRYAGAARELGIGGLHFGHIGKNGEDRYPFGSIFWHNFARATWYAQRDHESPDDNIFQIGLYNRKMTFDKKTTQSVILDACFTGNTTTFSQGDASESPTLLKKLPIANQIEIFLRRGSATITAIGEELGVGVNSISKTVDRYIAKNKLFTELSGKGTSRVIGLLASHSDAS